MGWWKGLQSGQGSQNSHPRAWPSTEHYRGEPARPPGVTRTPESAERRGKRVRF
jgi:hypothetical protein